MRSTCKCNGMSGACLRKTCFNSLPKLKDVGHTLKLLYRLAHKARVDDDNKIQILEKQERKLPVTPTDLLLYSENSPNYCFRNLSSGSQGTAGRACRIVGGTSRADQDHCPDLCTACGYEVKMTSRKKRDRCCKSTFEWCCAVKCKECKRSYKVYVCSRNKS